MGVGFHLVAERFGANVVGPHLSVADEEALIGGETFELRQRIARRCVAEGLIGDFQTAVVGDVFTAGEGAVAVQAGQYLDCVEETNHALGARFEVGHVLGRPPVAKIAFLVKLAALVVETVRHFVADHNTDRAVVGRIVGCGIEERRLQDAGGEANFVRRGVVVGVNSLRRHVPFVRIDGFVDAAGDFVGVIELGGATQILNEGEFFVNLQTVVVAPLVGIANLDAESVELLVGLLFGGGTHPSLLVNALTEGFLQVAHELKHTLLRAFGEIALNIHFADGHSQHAFHCTYGTLPTRAVLLGALHRAAVEVERDAAEIIAQGRSGAVDHVEFQIRLEGFEGRIGKNFLNLVNGLGLVDADFVHRGITLTQEEEIPVDAGIVTEQFGVGHLMIVAFDIAQLGGGIRSLGDAGFDTEHLFHLARSICLGRAGHDKKLLDISAISLTNFARGLVILQIVVTFAERQAALVDLHEVHLGILDVGAATYANHA